MRVLNAVRRILLLLVLIPVLAIVLSTLLRAFKAQRSNPIVSSVRDFANIFIIEPFRTVFPDQTYLQDALVALAAFGLLALLIIFVFRGLRAMVGARPPRVRTAPTPAAAPAPPRRTDAANAAPAADTAAADTTVAEQPTAATPAQSADETKTGPA